MSYITIMFLNFSWNNYDYCFMIWCCLSIKCILYLQPSSQKIRHIFMLTLWCENATRNKNNYRAKSDSVVTVFLLPVNNIKRNIWRLLQFRKNMCIHVFESNKMMTISLLLYFCIFQDRWDDGLMDFIWKTTHTKECAYQRLETMTMLTKSSNDKNWVVDACIYRLKMDVR